MLCICKNKEDEKKKGKSKLSATMPHKTRVYIYIIYVTIRDHIYVCTHTTIYISNDVEIHKHRGKSYIYRRAAGKQCNRKINDHAGWLRNKNNIVGNGVDIPGRAETQKPNVANTLIDARGQNGWHRVRRTT